MSSESSLGWNLVGDESFIMKQNPKIQQSADPEIKIEFEEVDFRSEVIWHKQLSDNMEEIGLAIISAESSLDNIRRYQSGKMRRLVLHCRFRLISNGNEQ